MEWIKTGNIQRAQVNDYEVEIIEKNGLHHAVGYKVCNGKSIIVRKYRPRKALGHLKMIIENDVLFSNGKPIAELELAWWQK